jgi:hypothetical protein
MRVFEIVAAVSEGRTLIDATAGALGDVRLPDLPATEVASAPPGSLVLVAPSGMGELAPALAQLPMGVDIIAFLPTTPTTLPVGQILEALSAAGAQAMDAVPVEHHTFRVALVAARREGLAPVASYLSGRPARVLDEAALKRIIGERVVEGLAVRARLADSTPASETEAVRAELAQVNAALAQVSARLDRILASSSYRLARRIARLKPGK